MSDFVIASTTDTQEAVNAAAGLPPEPLATEPETPTEQDEVEEVELPLSEDSEVESETAPAPDEGKTEKKQGKGRFSKRIDELVRERYEAQAEAEQLRQQLAQIQGQQQAKPIETAPAAASANGRPARSSFTSDEEWVDAVSAYNVTKALAARDAAERQRERQERDTAAVASYRQQAAQFAAEHPDFDDAVRSIQVPVDMAPTFEAAIKGLSNGPAVVYYLAEHPELTGELGEMNPIQAVAQIGAISASLSPKKSSSPRPAARVPAPLTPVGGSSRVAQSLSDIPDVDDWMAARRQQRHRR